MDKVKVVGDRIWGKQKEGLNLYMIVWQRMANSGFHYNWAKDETHAIERLGYSTKYCKMTCVKIDPEHMPVEVGTQN